MSENCPFCNLDDSKVFFQSDLVFAIWDTFPVTNGHALVVTYRHISSWFDATVAEQHDILTAVQQCKEIIVQKHGPDGFNIGINIGEVAGQTISHLHVHLIPRYEGDVPDPRGGVRHVIPNRGNYLHFERPDFGLLQEPPDDNLLIKGGDDPFLPHLRTCMDSAVSVDLAVAFILKSGVDLLREHFIDLISRGGRVRIITGDYLDVTDPDALTELLDLGEQVELQVFEVGKTSFHPKAYIFHAADGNGTAFVGSSNLSFPALRSGVEWNYRILRSETDSGFKEVTQAFQDLLVHPQTRIVDSKWIDDYRQRRGPQGTQRVTEIVEELPKPPEKPHSIQEEALAALAETRMVGNEAGLVVLATGLGKTWLSAFDSASDDFKRVLFVAHRDEILVQAMHTFRQIRPQARLGKYTGQEKSPDADVLFASIQTLGRVNHLRLFDREAFDYIIVDEFHHAAARTYRRLIEHFCPRFLLGLTATPERTDGGDLLALCQENLVFRKDIVAGIEAKLLCPFKYFGVPDKVDYSNIPWRSSRFDEEELTRAVATNQRAQNALEQYRLRGGHRALGFCCSQKHADFMAEYFRNAQVNAVSVHSGKTSAPRASSLEDLAAGSLDVVFAVDMFNEGLDIPSVDTILMLRPTESSIIWLQQFGRGLRRSEGKDSLKVIDYIGNHRIFLVKVLSLLQPVLGIGESDAEISAAMRLLHQGQAELPAGCEITYELEAIDIVKSLLRTRNDDDAIVAYFESFQERHGLRPTAVELYHAGYNPRSLQKTHGSWTKFLKSMGSLSPEENECLESGGNFLDSLETTQMTKSFKMVTLLSMLNRDCLPGEINIADLSREFRHIIRRTATLRADVGDSLDDDSAISKLIEKNPIKALCGGKGTGGTTYFNYSHNRFQCHLPVPPACREGFQGLARELVDWRLAEYLDRGRIIGGDGFVCKIIHANGRPILKLPNRKTTPGVPSGWVEITLEGKTYVANFAKEFINVIRTNPDSKESILAETVMKWFGPDTGKPGTRFQVAFEPSEDGLKLVPVGLESSRSTIEIWRHYKREDIPPLFEMQFNQAVWHQGFVQRDKHLFLLVTLEKSGLIQEYQYDDQFLSPERFQWQSQNRTKQKSKHGQMICNHQQLSIDVHLFIRRRKVLAGKASPFVYCGQVDFEKWKGESPITVTWKLQEAMPSSLRDSLSVPKDA